MLDRKLNAVWSLVFSRNYCIFFRLQKLVFIQINWRKLMILTFFQANELDFNTLFLTKKSLNIHQFLGISMSQSQKVKRSTTSQFKLLWHFTLNFCDRRLYISSLKKHGLLTDKRTKTCDFYKFFARLWFCKVLKFILIHLFTLFFWTLLITIQLT